MPTRNYRQLNDLPPSWLAECPSATTNQHTASHPTPAEAESSTFSPTQAFSRRIKPFPPILHIPPSHIKSPSQALKTPHYHTAQQPPKTHRPTRLKHPPTSTQTQTFTTSIAGQTPRFRKTKRTELSALELWFGKKRRHKMKPSPKTTQKPPSPSICQTQE